MAMGVGRAAGMPDYRGYFIPELWAPKMLYDFEKRSVFMEIATTEYEGMIKKMGDTVHVSLEPTVTIRNYVKGQKLIRDLLEPEKRTLVIDQAKHYALHVDDIDEAQANLSLIDEFADSAGRRMKESVDQTVLQGIYNSEDSSNSGNTAGADTSDFALGTYNTGIALTKENIVDKFADVATVLDEQSVPEENRWIIIPPAFANLLLISDLKDASFTGDSKSQIFNGRIPKTVAGFNVYVSRQLYSVTDGSDTAFYCLAGWKGALTFASQLVETRAVEANDTFGYYIDGLHVFGYEVMRPEGLAILYAYRG